MNKKSETKIMENKQHTKYTNNGMFCMLQVFYCSENLFNRNSDFHTTQHHLTPRKHFQVYSLNFERWISVAQLLLPSFNLNTTTTAKPSREPMFSVALPLWHSIHVHAKYKSCNSFTLHKYTHTCIILQ